MNLMNIEYILKNALLEDIGSGDVTTSSIIPENHRSKAVMIAKDDFLLAGVTFAERVFKLIDSGLRFKTYKEDGNAVKEGDVIAELNGNSRLLLMAERTALNLLQRLSGIATLTHKFVESVKGLPVKIVDTRKTTPGIRALEKYAVRVGGGCNHRFGLFDGILIKDNHINVVGNIRKAIKMAKKNSHHMLKIEVEAKSLREVRDALSEGAHIIMLDNMSIRDIRQSVNLIRGKNPHVIIEASGNMNLKNIRAVAETGVDLISIGALTHSAVAVDISMKVIPVSRV